MVEHPSIHPHKYHDRHRLYSTLPNLSSLTSLLWRVVLVHLHHATVYPTLAQIALDVLPSQASSVPCERVFSSSKLTATDRRSRLKAEVFEELQLMKATWRPQLQDFARLNSEEVDVVNEELFEDFFDMEREQMLWDTEFEPAEFEIN
ncbi:hypothetical protein D9615_008567 [Tricholomella constricta]|uniref:HAT C-terminal dimerisation domain-containing protein n=1 Tax=Tricholomella constricta TaxID=117010 RepID=A0A8H5M0K9_9AGAR|nr:hypothetical protein D9615_008567 [Tricholomella constricta]